MNTFYVQRTFWKLVISLVSLWRFFMIKTDRINAYLVAPGAMLPFQELNSYIKQCGLSSDLIELIKIRVSQLNGCAYCLQLHTKEAREQGESEERIYLLSAWRESNLYTKREQAALEWAETLTFISDNHVTDHLYDKMRKLFEERELTDLTALIGLVNSWNRFAISFKYKYS